MVFGTLKCTYKSYISPSESLNKNIYIYICNLRTSEIPKYVTYEGKHLESKSSGVNKNVINKGDNSCNTLQKLRVNNPLSVIFGQLKISSLNLMPLAIFSNKK